MTIQYAEGLEKKVDLRRVNLDALKPWIADKIARLLATEDACKVPPDVAIDFCYKQLGHNKIMQSGKEMQENISTLIQGKPARLYMSELWPLLLSAQSSPMGIPMAMIEAKKREILRRETDKNNIGQISKKLDEKVSQVNEIRKEEGIRKYNVNNDKNDDSKKRKKSKSRSRSRSKSKRKRSRSKSKKSRSRSRSKKRSRSRSKSKKNKSRSRSKSPKTKKNKSKSRSGSPKTKKPLKRAHSRSMSKDSKPKVIKKKKSAEKVKKKKDGEKKKTQKKKRPKKKPGAKPDEKKKRKKKKVKADSSSSSSSSSSSNSSQSSSSDSSSESSDDEKQKRKRKIKTKKIKKKKKVKKLKTDKLESDSVEIVSDDSDDSDGESDGEVNLKEVIQKPPGGDVKIDTPTDAPIEEKPKSLDDLEKKLRERAISSMKKKGP